MTMKRVRMLPVLLVALAVIFLSGCEIVKAKELIVSNTSSDVTIDGVMLSQYVGSRGRIFVDMMADGETIAPGESRSFYIAPSTSTTYGATISIQFSDDDDAASFTYEYKVNGRNRPVTVSYDGTDLSVSGSNAKLVSLI